jgi:hypothetical protein
MKKVLIFLIFNSFFSPEFTKNIFFGIYYVLISVALNTNISLKTIIATNKNLKVIGVVEIN